MRSIHSERYVDADRHVTFRAAFEGNRVVWAAQRDSPAATTPIGGRWALGVCSNHRPTRARRDSKRQPQRELRNSRITCFPHSSEIGIRAIRHRSRKLRVVEYVQKLGAEFDSTALRERHALEERHVPVIEPG